MNLAHLKEIAEKATPGPWRSHPKHFIHLAPCVDTLKGEYVCVTATDSAGLGKKDAEFIAAFNPTTALALIARIARLEKAASEIIRLYDDNYKIEHTVFADLRKALRSAT